MKNKRYSIEYLFYLYILVFKLIILLFSTSFNTLILLVIVISTLIKSLIGIILPSTINDIEFFYKVRRFLLLKNKCILQFVDSSIYYYILKNVVIEEKSKFFKLLWLLSPLFYIRCIKKIITSE